MSQVPRVALLAGGVGSSRLAVGFERVLGEAHLTLVVNTGDDHWRYGLRICPDLDTNMYALAGLQDRQRGWGLAGDTFTTMARLRELGDDPWFSLGDRDLATHLLRTALLGAGMGIAEVTQQLAGRLGINARLLPMTEAEVGTMIHTPDGVIPFEDFFVRLGARPRVEDVSYEGIDQSTLNPLTRRALEACDLVVIGPSNPLSSIGPILAVPGMRDAIKASAAPVVAVTPVVSGVPISAEGERRRARSRAAQLSARGLDHRAVDVAGLYRNLADVFVLDEADQAEAAEIRSSGFGVMVANTLIPEPDAAAILAEKVLKAVG
ncbi:MAG: 2-phospho-L-lactate transferase [Acidimicrobiales bacterium]|nr:MAG: 2-phospho-L-lactate transferase [Actinomycetota bacterium]MBV6506987.1 2-phospho-L-lactate transferase [Acidimicrobiales bacterium]RIK05799.1 MAG: 2-phospho-L-lactate transferase [Acidobacteriota bacterium]